MKKIGFLAFVSVLSLMSVLSTRLIIAVGGSTTHNVCLGQSIQDAINSAKSGDTIFVSSGTYYENVVVNRTVSLIGENRKTTIIHGNGAWLDVITIEADWVNITGFSITGGSNAIYFPWKIYRSNTSIIDCDIYNNIVGLYSCELCSQVSVINCNIFNNRYGIILFGSSHIIESCNVFSNDFKGIGLHTPSNKCIIVNCSVWNNRNHGAITVAVSSDHVIKNSHIFNNTLGVSFVGNGIDPVTGHIVTNCYISSNTYGIYFSSTLQSYINITNCDICNNEWGIHIKSYNSYSNSIYHNNFISNVNQAKDESMNSWDEGYPSGGNYWKDYTDLDLYSGPYQNESECDGIGDTPYLIDVENEDKYPLMYPRTLPDMRKVNYEFYGLLANYKELESIYDNLQISYCNLNVTYYDLLANYTSLQAQLNDLQLKHDSLANKLYIFLISTIVFIVTTVYLAIKKIQSEHRIKNT